MQNARERTKTGRRTGGRGREGKRERETWRRLCRRIEMVNKMRAIFERPTGDMVYYVLCVCMSESKRENLLCSKMYAKACIRARAHIIAQRILLYKLALMFNCKHKSFSHSIKISIRDIKCYILNISGFNSIGICRTDTI